MVGLTHSCKTFNRAVSSTTYCPLAYKANPNFDQEKKDAVDMLVRAVTAVDMLSPALEFVAFQTGAKV